jgi:acyl dehydratase
MSDRLDREGLCDTAPMTRTIDGIDGLKAAVGEHLGYSPWLEVTQERVNQFAEATGDHQWIHVDVERAKAESPFGGPIAHGYLTLSLLPSLMPKIVTTTGFKMGVNYGTNRVRFMSPVPVGSNLRLGAKLLSVEDISGGVQVVYEMTFEVEGNPKPACVAEVVLRSYV